MNNLKEIGAKYGKIIAVVFAVVIVVSILFGQIGTSGTDHEAVSGNSKSDLANASLNVGDTANPDKNSANATTTPTTHTVHHKSVPEYNEKAYITLNGNNPEFSKQDYTTTSFEYYSPLDSLGRCGVVYACIGKDLMPTEARGDIGQIKPTGWQTVKYDIVDGKYLYNRCHLIGWQLTAENANKQNLITGTRYFNTKGMLPFENMVADYIKETNNHVLYRVTPDFVGNELVARGVQMEAYSVEDDGDGICFNVYVYNIQPGITINYATGASQLTSASNAQSTKRTTTKSATTKTPAAVATAPNNAVAANRKSASTSAVAQQSQGKYILNTNTKKFHKPSCPSVDQMSEKNKKIYNGTRDTVVAKGYQPCKNCNP